MNKNHKEINKSDDLIKRSDLLEHIREFTSISSGYFENPELLERVIREMPNTEPKEDKDKEWFDGYEKGKIDGLNDAWKSAKKVREMVSYQREEIFGTQSDLIIFEKSPQEVLAKLKAYEEAQKIKVVVGDVVEITHCDEKFKGLVLDILDEISFVLLTENGMVESYVDERVKKTGKHIDIQSILEQIGEQGGYK